MTTVTASLYGSGERPTYALNELPAGVRADAIPVPAAGPAHRFMKPRVELTALTHTGLKKRRKQMVTDTISLQLIAYGYRDDFKPVVSFVGGPRDWWDTHEGYNNPHLDLDTLETLPLRQADHERFAASFQETFGRRFVTFAATKMGRGRRARKMVAISVSVYQENGIVTWTDAHDEPRWKKITMLVDAAALSAAIKALREAHEASDVIAGPIY